MRRLDSLDYLRPCMPEDDAFLYDVFCTTWESEIAALPNPNLALHVLRIQHTAQERRFAIRYPGFQRFVVVDGEPMGRLYVHEGTSSMHVIDVTLLPRFRSRGLGTRLARDLFAYATDSGRTITLRVARRNLRANDLYGSLGFRLIRADDLDNYFEWTPPQAGDRDRDLVLQADCA